jgi:hypothetical protein
MFAFFRALMERVKALFVSDAAQELETEFAVRAAGRKAALLRLAVRYEAEGLATVAADLRRHAGGLDATRPLAGVLPAVAHLAEEEAATASLRAPIGQIAAETVMPRLPEPSIAVAAGAGAERPPVNGVALPDVTPGPGTTPIIASPPARANDQRPGRKAGKGPAIRRS